MTLKTHGYSVLSPRQAHCSSPLYEFINLKRVSPRHYFCYRYQDKLLSSANDSFCNVIHSSILSEASWFCRLFTPGPDFTSITRMQTVFTLINGQKIGPITGVLYLELFVRKVFVFPIRHYWGVSVTIVPEERRSVNNRAIYSMDAS